MSDTLTPAQIAERLRLFFREQIPGGCRIISRGDACDCLLCDVDRLERHGAEALELLEQIAYAFDMLTIAEVKMFGGIPSYACAVEMNDLRQLLARVQPLLAPTREGRS